MREAQQGSAREEGCPLPADREQDSRRGEVRPGVRGAARPVGRRLEEGARHATDETSVRECRGRCFWGDQPHGRKRHGPGLRVPGEGSELGLIDMWHMRSMTHRRLSIALLVFALPLAAGACARPVGAVRVDPQKVQRELTGNVLSTGDLEPSHPERSVPPRPIRAIRRRARSGARHDAEEHPGGAHRSGCLPRGRGAFVLPRRDERQALVLPGRGGVRLDVPLPRRRRRACPGSSSTRVFAWPPTSTTEGSRSGSPRPTRP